MIIRQGEIYKAFMPISGRRPIIVVSRDALNRGDSIVVVLLTTKNLERRSRLPNYVRFRAGEFGLTHDCIAQCETIQNALVEELDPAPIGRLDDLTLRSLIHAIGDVIAIGCEADERV